MGIPRCRFSLAIKIHCANDTNFSFYITNVYIYFLTVSTFWFCFICNCIWGFGNARLKHKKFEKCCYKLFKIVFFWISCTFLVFCLYVKKCRKFQNDKKKTSNQKSAGNLIFVILISSNTNSYIFCALIPDLYFLCFNSRKDWENRIIKASKRSKNLSESDKKLLERYNQHFFNNFKIVKNVGGTK